MKTRKAICTICGLALALGVTVPMARADERNQATQLTFEQSVEVPGHVVLQPGTYWFKLADTSAAGDVVQVFDVNWNLVTSTVTTSTEQVQRHDTGMITLAERSADQPAALLKWFYPGDTFGHEFVYPGSENSTISDETVNIVTVPVESAPTVPASSTSGPQR